MSFAMLAGAAHAAPTENDVAQAKEYISDACSSWNNSARSRTLGKVEAQRFRNREDVNLDRDKLGKFQETFFKVCKPTPEEVNSLAGAIEGSEKLSRGDRKVKELDWKKQAEQIADKVLQRRLVEEAQIPQAEMEALISGMPTAKSCTGAFIGGAVVGGMLGGGGK